MDNLIKKGGGNLNGKLYGVVPAHKMAVFQPLQETQQLLELHIIIQMDMMLVEQVLQALAWVTALGVHQIVILLVQVFVRAGTVVKVEYFIELILLIME